MLRQKWRYIHRFVDQKLKIFRQVLNHSMQRFAVWYGGSTMASMSTFEQNVVMRAQFDEAHDHRAKQFEPSVACRWDLLWWEEWGALQPIKSLSISPMACELWCGFSSCSILRVEAHLLNGNLLTWLFQRVGYSCSKYKIVLVVNLQ